MDKDRGQGRFTGARETPTERHPFRVPLAGGDIVRVTDPGEWHEATVAPAGE